MRLRIWRYPIIFKAIIGLGHAGSPIADNLGLKFFDYALSVRQAREDFYLKKRMGKLAKSETGPWVKAFKTPEFFGDIVNQDCFPKDQVAMIPGGFRVALPTKNLADAWNK